MVLPSLVRYVSAHAALNMRRKELVKEQQGALAERKTLSAEIGKLMREKKVRPWMFVVLGCCVYICVHPLTHV